MDDASSFDDYRMPDELWELLQPLLPKYPTSTKVGRPRADLRGVADAIFSLLRTAVSGMPFPGNWLLAARLFGTFRSG
jgi:putative transposase